MQRQEFLSILGLSAGALVFAPCLSSCAKKEEPLKVDFQIDLNDASNASLQQPGGFLKKDSVIIAHTTSGTFIAVEQTCPHQQGSVNYISSSKMFRCPNHGSEFDESGEVTKGPANEDLQKFNCVLNGNLLHVFS